MSDLSPYAGSEALEIMSGAKNYNSHLLELLRSEVASCKTRSARGKEFTILDFGAGNGRFISAFDGNSAALFAVEPDPALSGALSQVQDVAVVSLSSIESRSIDFIYSLNVFEHIYNDADTLVELSEKLSPGGRLLVFVPAWPHLFSAFDQKIGHFRRYTKKDLLLKAEQTELNLDRLELFDPLGYFAAVLFKMFSNKPVLPSRGLVLFDRVVYPISRLLLPLTRNSIGKNLVMVLTRT